MKVDRKQRVLEMTATQELAGLSDATLSLLQDRWMAAERAVTEAQVALSEMENLWQEVMFERGIDSTP